MPPNSAPQPPPRPASTKAWTPPATDALTIMEPLCAVFRRKLKSVRLKYTPERARILDAVVSTDEPFQVEQLIARLRAAGPMPTATTGRPHHPSPPAQPPGPPVSKATVYRTMKLLVDAGIVQQVLFDAEHAHYQLAYGQRSSGLLIRTDTRQITQLDLPELAALRDRLCRERGLMPQGHRFVVYASLS
ncbi:MAG: Fur family transcriptional regulator [Phycisphaerales bacterium]